MSASRRATLLRTRRPATRARRCGDALDDEPLEYAAGDDEETVTDAGATVEVAVDAGAVKMMPGNMACGGGA